MWPFSEIVINCAPINSTQAEKLHNTIHEGVYVIGDKAFDSEQIIKYIEDVYRGDGLNLYVYVVNNPLLWIDPSGYATIKCNQTNNENDNAVL